jgi:hypothetical protein
MGIANKVSVLGVKRKKFYPPHILEDRRKQNPKATNFYFETEYDTATLRFVIERFLAAARQGVDITVSPNFSPIEKIKAALRGIKVVSPNSYAEGEERPYGNRVYTRTDGISATGTSPGDREIPREYGAARHQQAFGRQRVELRSS